MNGRPGALLFPARLGFVVFCLLTSVFCLLAYLPFTFQQVIEFQVISGTTLFARVHPWLYWLAFACALLTLAGDYRSGARARVLWFTGAGVAAGIVLALFPLLAGIRNVTRNLVWACLWLVPLWWIAIIDLAGPGARLEWRAAREDDAREFWASLLTGIGVALIYAGIQLAVPPPGGTVGPGPVPAGVLAWSTGLHALAFLALFLVLVLVRGVAAAFARPALAQFVLLCAGGGVLLAAVIRAVVLAAVSMTGRDGLAMAAAYAATIVVSAAGVSVRLWGRAEPVESGVELALRPLGPSPRSPLWLRLALVGAWFPLAWFLSTSTRIMDWNYLVQTLAALLVWLTGFVWIHAALPRRMWPGPARLPVLVLVPAVLLVAFRAAAANPDSLATLGIVPGNRAAVFDRYAGFDASFRILHGLVRSEPAAGDAGVDMGAFYALLQRHTNISRTVTIPTPDLDLVPRIAPARDRLPHVFFIVIDSLRQDYLSPYNPAVTFTPSVARFARDEGTVVFRNAFTRYGATGLSEPAIWSGSLLPHQQYPAHIGRAFTLQKLVRGLGYECFVSVDTLLRGTLEPWPGLHELDLGVPGRDLDLRLTLKELEARLRERPAGPRSPVFAYTQPQNIHVSAIAREGQSVPAGETYPGFYAPYASRVKQLDTALGTFLDALRSLGLYDESIVILTSDHGDSLGEDGRFGHAYTIYPEILRIPLLVHLPTWLRGLSADPDAVVMSTDITPSLYYLLGQRPTANLPLLGRPMFTERPDERDAYRRADFVVASSYGPVYGLLTGDGASLYIADATNYREYSYDLSTGTAGSPRAVTAAFRRQAAGRIRETIGQVAGFYHVPVAQ